MDDYRKVIEEGFARQRKERDERAHQRVCAFMASTVERAIVRKLEDVGFVTFYEYWSHAHNRTVFVMIRPVTKKEWQTLKPDFRAKARPAKRKKKG